MSGKQLFGRLACYFELHQWEPKVSAMLHQGLVYPLQLRICARCGKCQQKVFVAEKSIASWIAHADVPPSE